MSIRTVAIICVALLAAGQTGQAGSARVFVKYGTFDPLVGEPLIPTDLRTATVPGQDNYFIVQFAGPIEDGWTSQVEALGAKLLDYIPDFAFIAQMTPEIAEKARSLEAVRWVGLFHPAYRIDPELRRASGNVRVKLAMFRGRASAQARLEVEHVRGTLHEWADGPRGAHMDATVPANCLARLAQVPEVEWIEPYRERKLHNNVARGIMNVPATWSGAGLYGSGEIVAVCDTGLDTGSQSTLSADFAGRVIKTYALGRKNKWNDPHGHGTHVAGSVLGSGVLSGSNPAGHDYTNSFAGTAPEAQLVFQSVLDNTGGLKGIPSDLNNLFLPTYNDGARVHTNSWGAAAYGVYTTDSRNVDMFTWNRKDFTVLFSAGNEGKDGDANGVVDPDSIDSPATAKNCITVGASENYRLSGGAQGTYGGYWPTDYPADPIKSDKVSNNSSGIIAFSSRGPTDDGRIKPDVVAPGTNVISCRSHASGAGTLWGVYNADYVYSGGTSMSTPLTAGVAALVRQYYRTQRTHLPSSALVKATIINGATDLYPGQYGTGASIEISGLRPNNVEGWELANPGYLIPPSSSRALEFVDNDQGLATNGSVEYPYHVNAGSDPLRITLVWTDYPASTSASKALVNDLDLVVVLPDATILRGNGATDRLNNVEGVDISSPVQGDYTVRVEGYNVPQGPQPFALVVSGPTGLAPPTAVIDSPAQGTQLFGAVTIKGTASGADFQQYVLEYGAGASPSSWLQIGSTHYAPVESGVLGTWDTSLLGDSLYTLRLTVTGTGGTATSQVGVNVLRTSISAEKDNPNETTVTLTGKIVTAGPNEFVGVLYAQEPDRTGGIRVNLLSTPEGAAIGSTVTIIGTLTTIDGERVIVNPTVTVTGDAPSADLL